MKRIFLTACILLSASAFATELSKARTVIIHPTADLRVFSDKVPSGPMTLKGYGNFNDSQAGSCNLDLSLDTLPGIVKVANFSGQPGGAVYSMNMVRDYYLFVTSQESDSAKVGSGTQTTVTLKLIDSRQNRSTLVCVSDFSSDTKTVLQTTDVNIKGVEAK